MNTFLERLYRELFEAKEHLDTFRGVSAIDSDHVDCHKRQVNRAKERVNLAEEMIERYVETHYKQKTDWSC